MPFLHFLGQGTVRWTPPNAVYSTFLPWQHQHRPRARASSGERAPFCASHSWSVIVRGMMGVSSSIFGWAGETGAPLVAARLEGAPRA
ncbi:hypothetical protein AUW26_28225 [Streptomyces sp. CC71]|nr:hypothetical protein AUW26_28225 [Streptomyces sp. CC71]